MKTEVWGIQDMIIKKDNHTGKLTEFSIRRGDRFLRALVLRTCFLAKIMVRGRRSRI